jgi:hypothetical protein
LFVNSSYARSMLSYLVMFGFWFWIIVTFSPNYYLSISDFPQKITTGLPNYLAKLTTPWTNFPPSVWLSNLPSPVIMISAYLILSFRFTISVINWNPLTILALKNAMHPAPSPPAAPPPGVFYRSLLKCFINCLFNFIRPS